MNIIVHQDVKDLLNELNQFGNSCIFGGYLRDQLLNVSSSDVDIVTNIPIEIIESMYSNMEKATSRKTTSGHNVFSFKMNRTEKMFIEIVCTKDEILKKGKVADYTINSLVHDGHQVLDIVGGLKDLEAKIIREVDIDIINRDLVTRPYLWLKTLRLQSISDFTLSTNVFNALNLNKDTLTQISSEIFQTEGHKTLNGRNPLKAIKTLSELELISEFENRYSRIDFDIPLKPQQKLCSLALLLGKAVIDQFISFYQFSDEIKLRYEELYNLYISNEKYPNRLKHHLIAIKKIVEKVKNENGIIS